MSLYFLFFFQCIKWHCNDELFYQDWLHCISTDHQVSATECCPVWRNILKHWIAASGQIKWCLGRWPLRMPAYTSIVDIQLSAPNETFILDDLKLKELFMRASARAFQQGRVPVRTDFQWGKVPSVAEFQWGSIPAEAMFQLGQSSSQGKVPTRTEIQQGQGSNKGRVPVRFLFIPIKFMHCQTYLL